MFYRINPYEIVKAHFDTFYDYRTNKKCTGELFFQFIIAAILAFVHYWQFTIDSNTVGIIVSASSIVAGLLLNLMVMIYSLLNTKADSKNTTATELDDFKKVSNETLSNIAFCVFVCVIVVISSLLNLTDNIFIKSTGHVILIFSGVILIFTMMMVLLRFYRLISNNMK